MSTPEVVAGDNNLADGSAQMSAPPPPRGAPADGNDCADKNNGTPNRISQRWPELFTLLLILLFGMGIRLWLVLLGDLSASFDTGAFAAWTRGMVEHGLGGFFESGVFCDYPPLAMLVFWVVGHLMALFDGAMAVDDVLFSVLKIPACLADFAIALMLYTEGRRLLGGWRGVGAAAIYFLNPLPLYDSAYWGQIDSMHAAFVLLCLIFMNRGHWRMAGFAVALAMLQKFQSIAFVPLVVFECYRYLRWRGVGSLLVGVAVGAVLVCLPFALTGSLDEVLYRSYVGVIGQYPELAKGAYNIWQFADYPDAHDVTLPGVIAHIVADGRAGFPENDSPLLLLTLRRVSLIGYSISVALILTLYSYRPGAIARSGAAGLLFIAFFLIPTEMHERYAFPAMAVLAFWAATDAWKERAYFLLSVLFLLNISAVFGAEGMADVIAGMITALFAVMLIAPFVLRWAENAEAKPVPVRSNDAGPKAGDSAVIRWFRRATWASVVVFLSAAAYIGYAASIAKTIADDGSVLYLSALAPVRVQQEWGELRMDRSVSGGVLHLGESYYVRGLGTHAPSTLDYEIPDGFETFEATAGVSRYPDGEGSVVVSVLVDDVAVFESELLTGAGEPVSVSVPLNGGRRLTLKAETTSDGMNSDHVDWAAARMVNASR